jgi:4-hydroxybenzoate polyprenyltransferase
MVKLAFLWFFLLGNRFSNSFLLKPLGIKKIETKKLCNYHFDGGHPNLLKEKIDGLVNITRIKENFIPTSILIGLSGYIANKEFLTISQFWAAFSIIHMISSAGMIMNDLFDIDTDKINNPERPLIKGTVTMGEAETLTTIFLIIIPIIGSFYLPVGVAPYWWSASWILFFYTPILKRWFLVKNLVCALVVSSTVPFIALSLQTPINNVFITLTTKTIFMASLYIELLLDITDVKGDNLNGITTVPVVFGKYATVIMATITVTIGFINMLVELCLNRVPVYVIAGIIISYSPFYVNLLRIWSTKCSPEMIDRAVKQTTLSLMIYFVMILVMQLL